MSRTWLGNFSLGLRIPSSQCLASTRQSLLQSLTALHPPVWLRPVLSGVTTMASMSGRLELAVVRPTMGPCAVPGSSCTDVADDLSTSNEPAVRNPKRSVTLKRPSKSAGGGLTPPLEMGGGLTPPISNSTGTLKHPAGVRPPAKTRPVHPRFKTGVLKTAVLKRPSSQSTSSAWTAQMADMLRAGFPGYPGFTKMKYAKTGAIGIRVRGGRQVMQVALTRASGDIIDRWAESCVQRLMQGESVDDVKKWLDGQKAQWAYAQ